MFDINNWPWWAVLGYLVIDITVRVVSIIVVPRNRRPTSAMAWLLAIFLIPVSMLLGPSHETGRAIAMALAWLTNLLVAELAIRRRAAAASR